MALSKEKLILYSATQDNILPLTSACNVKCVFCSHRQNPAGVQVYGIPHRTQSEVLTTLEFMDAKKKIVIGESVTRIMEGEPFLHPEIETILRLVRSKFPKTPVQITTNGTLLTEERLALLEELGGIELYISLNSVTERGRELLMGVKEDCAKTAVAQLKSRGINFQGSIVAMPWIVGYDDIEETIGFFAEHGAETIRIFMPGFTKLAPAELRFGPELPLELKNWVVSLRSKYRTPLIVEPAFPSDLKALVGGVVPGLPAGRAGFQLHDEILDIGGEKPFSRVDAFYRLTATGNTAIHITRNGREMTLQLQKKRGERSGLVFAYDVHPEVADEVLTAISRHRAKRPLLLCAVLAYPIIEKLAQRLQENLTGVEITCLSVENRFFGGSIMAAGLLVVQDFLDCWASLSTQAYDLVLIPGIFLDPWGVDLTGRKVDEMEEQFGVKVIVIE